MVCQARCSLLLLVVLGCQPSGPEYPELDAPLLIPGAELAPPSSPPRPKATLYRDEVTGVVEAGLGRFLQRLSVDADLEHGHFRGFRILELNPPEFWQDVDLRPGDVVTSVNGMSIERPVEAHRAFASLATAERLVVAYTRGGEPRSLIYEIKERPGARRSAAPPAQPAKGQKPGGAGAGPSAPAPQSAS